MSSGTRQSATAPLSHATYMPCGFSAAPNGSAQAAPTTADSTDVKHCIAPMLVLPTGILLTACTSMRVDDPSRLVDDPSSVHIRHLAPPPRESMVLTIRQLEPARDEDPAAHDVPAPADLIAIGFASITAQPGTDAAQRRLQAARAAKLDAYRNLAEQIHGVEFASDSVVADTRVREDNIRVRIQGVIAGAEIVALEPLGNDSYQATVRLPAHKVAALQRR